ncbi:MAG: DUF1122 family protein, partial [Candidatus Micrarchaeota archaeon]
MLFKVGCGSSWRDWYIAEGGHEGSQKLQGFKALNEKFEREGTRQNIKELR